MYPSFAKWIKSHRDLPLKLNQWCNVVVCIFVYLKLDYNNQSYFSDGNSNIPLHFYALVNFYGKKVTLHITARKMQKLKFTEFVISMPQFTQIYWLFLSLKDVKVKRKSLLAVISQLQLKPMSLSMVVVFR